MPLYLGGSINRFTIRFLLRGLLKADKKKCSKCLHISKSPSIFAPRLRENATETWSFGSLGEWLKPAVC